MRKLRTEIEALRPPPVHRSRGELTEEEISYWGKLIARWERGENLAHEDQKHVEVLDEIGPVLLHIKARREGRAGRDRPPNFPECYLSPQTVEARRKRVEARRE
jgi:hypothetical protein